MHMIGMADVEKIVSEQKTENELSEFNIDSLEAKNRINEFLNTDEDIPRVDIQDKIQHQEEKQDFFGEKMSDDEIFLISRNIQYDLDSLEYNIIPKKPDLNQEYLNQIDILAYKIVQVNDLLDIIHIIPIKVSDLNGSLIFSEDIVDYKSITQKFDMDKAVKKILIGSKIKDLKHSHDLIFDDLINEGDLFQFFKKYFKTELTVEKTRSNKKLFFHSGPLQYKIIIEPTLACKNEPGFLEKSIPFALQKRYNIHAVKSDNLVALLSYLEQKNCLIETHSEQVDPFNTYFKSIDKFSAEVRLYSIPFTVYGFIILLMVVFQAYPLLRLFINLGYAALGIYIAMMFYLYFKFHVLKSEIQKEFNTPYYLLPVKFDESSLILISEELSPELMAQFTYECLGKRINYDIIAELEEKRNLERNSKKASKKSVSSINNFRNMIGFEKNIQTNDSFRKYSSFLED